ncbi:integrase catalytic domain-containing protein [Trichonephila clavipes]|nr:integrase catalytic domain-containing protein [Trichonephila clavipes]
MKIPYSANLPSSTIDTLTPEPRSSIKLPKLTVNKFYGDHKNWFYQNNSDKTTFHSHKEESDDSVTSVSSCQTETESQRVLLQTASVVARYNKQFRNCRLLADTAAQRSFVERKFSR